MDGGSLLWANLQPRSIEFRDLQLRASLNRDGKLSFSPDREALEAGGGETVVEQAAPAADATPPQVSALDGASDSSSPVSVAVGSLFDLIVGPRGVLGSLDTARVTNARLTLVDGEQRERATFRRVNATFDRSEAGGRRFDATL